MLVCLCNLFCHIWEPGAFWKPQGQTDWLCMPYGLHDCAYEQRIEKEEPEMGDVTGWERAEMYNVCKTQ